MIGEGGKERRERVNFDNIIDALSTASGGTYLTLCYISAAKIGKTLTGKNIDIDKFGKDIEQFQRKGTRGYDVLKNFHQGGASRKNTLPVGIIKRSIITFHWQTEDKYGEAYGKYKEGANQLLKPYGVEIGSRDDSEKHDEKQNFGNGNVSVGATDNTRGKLYTHQNGATVDKYNTSYLMVKDGKLYGGINKDAIASLVKKEDPEGVKALRDLGVQEDEIKKYIENLKNLNFSILKLMYERILWVSCTIDGVKKFAINDRLTDKIGSGNNAIPINPNVFIKLANNRYDKKYNPLERGSENLPITHINQKKYYDMYGESVNKKEKRLIRLTEGELHNLIKGMIKKHINEWGDRLSPEAMDDKAYMQDRYDQKMRLLDDEFERKNRAIRKKYPGKSDEWYEAMLDTFCESKNYNKKTTLKESFKNNQNYSHFAVNKATNKIVNGWDYNGYDPEELRQFKKDYFTVDLIDYGLDPKQYKIVTAKFLIRQGIDPDDNNNWAQS